MAKRVGVCAVSLFIMLSVLFIIGSGWFESSRVDSIVLCVCTNIHILGTGLCHNEIIDECRSKAASAPSLLSMRAAAALCLVASAAAVNPHRDLSTFPKTE